MSILVKGNEYSSTITGPLSFSVSSKLCCQLVSSAWSPLSKPRRFAEATSDRHLEYVPCLISPSLALSLPLFLSKVAPAAGLTTCTFSKAPALLPLLPGLQPHSPSHWFPTAPTSFLPWRLLIQPGSHFRTSSHSISSTTKSSPRPRSSQLLTGSPLKH